MGKEVELIKSKKACKKQQTIENQLLSNKIFIGGLPLKTKLKEILDYFSKYGEIIDKVIIKDKNNKFSKGYGFITFKKIEDAIKVIKDYSNHEIRGKWVEVKYALPKFMNPKYKKEENQTNKLVSKSNTHKTSIKNITSTNELINLEPNNKNIITSKNLATISTTESFILKNDIKSTNIINKIKPDISIKVIEIPKT